MRFLVSFQICVAQRPPICSFMMVSTGEPLAYKLLASLEAPFSEKENREAVFKMGYL